MFRGLAVLAVNVATGLSGELLVMFGRNAFIVAVASAAAHSGAAAAAVSELMVKGMDGEGIEGMSEREIMEARVAAALRAQKKEKKGWSMPRVNWRGVMGAVTWRRPRLAA